jgi:sialate O-acetylesterase
MHAVSDQPGIRLAKVFSDHAVLQRDMPVPVWGWTHPGARVRIALGPHVVESRSAEDGSFLVRLPPMPAGGPYELHVRTVQPACHAQVRDVMVGEVWLCSGQSNMEWPLNAVPFDTQTLTDEDRLVRALNVPLQARIGRARDVAATWQVAQQNTAGSFSAVGFFLARRLARELGVAVGIINASWGGTRIQGWIGRSELVRHAWARAEVARYEASVAATDYWHRFDPREPDCPEALAEAVRELYQPDPGNTGVENGWADPAHDDTDWDAFAAPAGWTTQGYNTNGVFWFRREVDIPATWAGRELTLSLGAIDKQDVTYFNGCEVGRTGRDYDEQYWNVPRTYPVPGNLVKPGRAVIAVRVYSFAFDGGLIGPANDMTIRPVDAPGDARRLDGTWRVKIAHDLGRVVPGAIPFGPGNPQSPYILNDNMIQPLIPYAIRGAAWYQGESNEADGSRYAAMLRALIEDWRYAWGQGDFPFLTVQLANHHVPADYEEASLWARIREAQLASLRMPHTGLAVAVDIGDALDIHPRNKQDVGHRLAQWALARVYHRPIVPSGPIYRDLAIEGNRIRLTFDHVGGGLEAKHGALETFVIAGNDRCFVPAEARIEDSSVVVHSPSVAEPVAVRYAWADNPEAANLYNSEGLPASPFRTDSW